MKVKVKEAYKEDIGKGLICIDFDLVGELNLNIDDIVKISNPLNDRNTAAKLKIGESPENGSKTVRIGAILRRNIGVSVDDKVEICKIETKTAKEVIFINQNLNFTFKNTNQFAKKLENRIITTGDIFSFKHNDKIIDLIISDFSPKSEAVIISKNTSIIIQDLITHRDKKPDLLSLYESLDSRFKNMKCEIDKINNNLASLKQK